MTKIQQAPTQVELDKAFRMIDDWTLHYYQLLLFHNPPLTTVGKGYPFNIRLEMSQYQHYLIVEAPKPEFNFTIQRGMTDNKVLENCKLILANLKQPKVSPQACCGLATHRACVCYASFDCPLHGRKCIGTHD